MASLLSDVVDNLAEGIQKIKYKDCDRFLEYEIVEDNLIKCKCLSYHKDYSKKIDKELKKRFKSTFKFSMDDSNKFVLMLRKGVYPYEYMEEWKKFSETLLPEKDDFYGNPSMENITDTHYMHAKRFSNDFEIKSQGEYHDFYLKSDTLLLIDVFKNFQKNVCRNLSSRYYKSFSQLQGQHGKQL